MTNPTQSPAETKPQVGETWRTNDLGDVVVEKLVDDRFDCRIPSGGLCLLGRDRLLCRVSPAAAVSDRLFETGCVLCGAANPYAARCGGPHRGAAYCEPCFVAAGPTGDAGRPRHEGIDAEITRRRSLAEPGFKVGDEVEWDEADNARHSGEGEVGIGHGRISEMIDARDMRVLLLPSGNLGCGDGAFWHVDPKAKSLRLIRRAPTEAARTGDARFYGKQPDVLPETLPAGCEWVCNRGMSSEYRFRLLSPARNRGGWIAGRDEWDVSGKFERIAPDHELLENNSSIRLKEIDWTTVPLPPATAGGERQIKCPVCQAPWELAADRCSDCPTTAASLLKAGLARPVGPNTNASPPAAAAAKPCPDCKRESGHSLACPEFDNWIRNGQPLSPSPADAEAMRMHEEALRPFKADEMKRAALEVSARKSEVVYFHHRAMETRATEDTARFYRGRSTAHDLKEQPTSPDAPAYSNANWPADSEHEGMA